MMMIMIIIITLMIMILMMRMVMMRITIELSEPHHIIQNTKNRDLEEDDTLLVSTVTDTENLCICRCLHSDHFPSKQDRLPPPLGRSRGSTIPGSLPTLAPTWFEGWSPSEFIGLRLSWAALPGTLALPRTSGSIRWQICILYSLIKTSPQGPRDS